MGSEFLLYAYGMVCISMLIFNIVYNVLLQKKDKAFEKKVNEFSKIIEEQIQKIRSSEEMDKEHLTFLYERLRKISNLVAFEQVMEKYMAREYRDLSICEYYEQLQDIVLDLAAEYNKRNNIQAAYYAFFLSRYTIDIPVLRKKLQPILVNYMKKDSLYCRVNALQALYNFGSDEGIVEAISLLDKQDTFLHEKILTDGLLTFPGDFKKLIMLLWKRFDEFSSRTRLAILNYIRLRTGDYQEEMLSIMNDSKMEKELRLSAIRYFDRYPYEPARKSLIDIAKDEDLTHWEYVAISVTALAKYQGADVSEVLINCLHSSNWHVRSNAAESLEAHELDYSDLIDVVGGNDRYAREMMMYRLENRRKKEQTEERI